MSGTLVWFRHDLRLRDNPALHAAARRPGWIIPVYIWSPEEEGEWPLGTASRWWLHRSLHALDSSLQKRGSRLILARGRASRILQQIAHATGASAVYWNHRYEPSARLCSDLAEASLHEALVQAKAFSGNLLAEPHAFLNSCGRPYRVYAAYRRRLLRDACPALPLSVPGKLAAPRKWPRSLKLADLELLPRARWYAHMEHVWKPGEDAARVRLNGFIKRGLANYGATRDQPAIRGTSRLSPYLRFGEISARQVWAALGPKGRSTRFADELIWREFAHHLLFYFPYTATQPLREEFNRFPWQRDVKMLQAWRRGRTGIPLVDAGMRELWSTGWMHNRVRMVTASFLVKNLLIPWQEGARWFWDTLVDAELANNTLNWQWVAGSGADAAPYFRVFNPASQAKRFDPNGEYIRRWVKEDLLRPIVDLRESRERALEAYCHMRREAK